MSKGKEKSVEKTNEEILESEVAETVQMQKTSQLKSF